MTKLLPPNAHLSHLKKQSKELLRDGMHGHADALRRFAEFNPRSLETGVLFLHEAQLVVAREYGFDSWPKLHQHVAEQGGDDSQVSINTALQTLRRGGMVILFDDEGRENEGDFVMAAEAVTAEGVNFMTRHGRGTLCLAMAPDLIDRLGLPLMSQHRRLPSDPAFTLSIDASAGVTTGVSAADRATTIRTAVHDGAGPASIRSPGHVFPLRAEPQGLLTRLGHTEGSVDLVQLAGMKPAAVICEILNDDGTMARLPDLQVLAERLELPLLTISEVLARRRQR